MATATLPQAWRGRSGRNYVPVLRTKVRHGALAIVRKVVGRGGSVGTSTAGDGVPLALKQWLEGDDASLEMLQAEARIMVELTAQSRGDLPCPRLYDLVGDPVVTGIVMEWCPGDLERWWRDKLKRPDAFGRLMATMAEASLRLADYHAFHLTHGGRDTAHGNIKPSNVLLSMSGRWLLSDFGVPVVRPPDDSPWATSNVVVGTENFVAPELLFHATKRFPPAMDTWAMGATLFALLRLQRLVLDGGPVPRNGTASPRFRMHRATQVLDLYAADPTRFRDRDLEPALFPDPLRLPDQDRRAVRECLRGVFGEEDPSREDRLSEELLLVLDRAMSIDPAHRFTTARDLAAAFEGLTRTFIELSAEAERLGTGAQETEVLDRAREEALRRADNLEDEVAELRDQMTRLVDQLVQTEDELERTRETTILDLPDPEDAPTEAVPAQLMTENRTMLVMILATQVLTLFVIIAVAAWMMVVTVS